MVTPMKSFPLAALALGAALALPAAANAAGKPSVANDQTSGVGEVWLGFNFLSDSTATPTDDDSYLGLGGDLRLNIPAGGSMSIQLDLASETGFADNSNDNYTGSVLGGAHVSFRDPAEWLLGGFVGVGNGFNADDDSVTAWLIGGEGQYYCTDWTFYAQLGYLDGSSVGPGIDEAFGDAWFLRGIARFFLDSNAKLEGELSYADGEHDGDGDDMDVLGWGLRYDRAINSMDAAVFVAYEGNHYSSDEPGSPDDLTEHVIKLGVSLAFGIEGQKYIDRHGATLDLPMVTRWSTYGDDVLD
jgi:hypothetical protein